MTEFTILTISHEPVLTVLRFVAWHRAMGASRIVIYFSRPDDPAIAYLRDLAFVESIPCTPAFWREIGLPEGYGFVGRQSYAMTHGYRSVKSGWVGVLDCDELFYDGEGALVDWLARIRPEINVLRLRVGEAISYRDGAGGVVNDRYFRLSWPGRDFSPVYGPLWSHFRAGAGTVGHFRGKSIARAGLEISAFRQHWPEDGQGREIPTTFVPYGAGRLLLHFFEAGWGAWRRKINWRLGSGSISTGLAAYLRSLEGGEKERLWRETYEALHVFDAQRLEILRKTGGLFIPARDTLAPARALFGADLIEALQLAEAEAEAR